MRIIDRDIEFYSAMVDGHIDAMRRCEPSDEARHRNRRDAAIRACDALRAYRDLIDRESTS